LVARVVFDPQDPDGRRMLYAAALKAGADLFGPSSSARHPAPPPPASEPESAGPPAPPPARSQQTSPTPAPVAPVPSPPELPAPAGEDDFHTIDPMDQVATLEELMQRKGYLRADLESVMARKGYGPKATSSERPIEHLSPGDRTLLWNRLR